VEETLANTPGVQSTASIIGFSLLSLTRSSYNAFFFVTLKNGRTGRKEKKQYQFIRTSLNRKLSTMPQGTAFGFSPPAIPGVGTSADSRSCWKTVPAAMFSSLRQPQQVSGRGA